jgi:hypothetical protein
VGRVVSLDGGRRLPHEAKTQEITPKNFRATKGHHEMELTRNDVKFLIKFTIKAALVVAALWFTFTTA